MSEDHPEVMISSVIFDSFCLDMCLSFGCNLDVVMLHLLGDALVMCGPNSDVGINDQLSTHLAVDDFGVVQLLNFTVHHMPY